MYICMNTCVGAIDGQKRAQEQLKKRMPWIEGGREGRENTGGYEGRKMKWKIK